MTYAQALVLGLVQGATEFLPVSSSGHLILVPYALGWPDQGLAFDAVMHLGTLAALVAYFRLELVAILASVGGGAGGHGSRRLALLLIAATIPGGIAGVLFDRLIEVHLRLPIVVGLSTLVWAVVMLAADRLAAARPAHPEGERSVGWRQGLLVGCAQAVALIPGTSRSGITISAGLLGGLDRSTAARFAFLLGIPITAGAGALKALHLAKIGVPPADRGPLVVALLASFVAGWAAVWFLVNYLRRNSLTPFVAYRIALGLILLTLVLTR